MKQSILKKLFLIFVLSLSLSGCASSDTLGDLAEVVGPVIVAEQAKDVLEDLMKFPGLIPQL